MELNTTGVAEHKGLTRPFAAGLAYVLPKSALQTLVNCRTIATMHDPLVVALLVVVGTIGAGRLLDRLIQGHHK